MNKIKMINRELNLYWNIEYNNESYTTTYGVFNQSKNIENYRSIDFKDEIIRKCNRGYEIIDPTTTYSLKNNYNYSTYVLCKFDNELECNNYVNYLFECINLMDDFDNEIEDVIEYSFDNVMNVKYESLISKIPNSKKYNTIILLKDIKCNIINQNDNIICVKKEEVNLKVLLNELYNNVVVDKRKIFSILRRAVNENYIIQNSFIDRCYENGIEDIYSYIGFLYQSVGNSKCIEFYEKSKEVSDEDGIIRLAICFLEGTMVKIDYKSAFELLTTVNEKNERVLFYLAYMYKNGYGTDINYEKSLSLFNEIINDENIRSFKVDSMVEVAKMHTDGLGVVQDVQKGFYYLRTAIEFIGDGVYETSICNPYKELVELKKKYTEVLSLDKYFNFNMIDHKTTKGIILNENWCSILDEKNLTTKKQLVIDLFHNVGLIKFAEELREMFVDVFLVKEYSYKLIYILDTPNGYKIFESNIHTEKSMNFLNSIKDNSIRNLYENINNGFWYSYSFVPYDYIKEVEDINYNNFLRVDELHQKCIIDENKNEILVNKNFIKNIKCFLSDEVNVENSSMFINDEYPNKYFIYNDIKREFSLCYNIISFLDGKITSQIKKCFNYL
ncbi:MAG: tetratricopeptide repeat protein [bacterium]